MRKATTILTLMLALFLILSSATLADMPRDSDVPFGLTYSKDGQYVPVFESTDGNVTTRTDPIVMESE